MLLADAIQQLARLRKISLPPDWQSGIFEDSTGDPLEDLEAVAWPSCSEVEHSPSPEDFPLLAYMPGEGWRVAQQRTGTETVETIGAIGPETVDETAVELFADVAFPGLALGDAEGTRQATSAASVFIASLTKRRSIFAAAILATVFANILALITSLYSMQIYDRVIPRSGYSTLLALTAGAAIGLLFDFILRFTRALMMEREAARVDEEVSEYFFARMQSIRLDARPPSVGTLASQLRGMEQVRGLLSSSFMFLVADLPFALFFIWVIQMLGGIIFVVPLITFPLSILLAIIFARLIRNDTDRAQVTGNRKNGLLVESLDAAETVKANSGDWSMLAKWNRLVREVHDYEDPVKRISATASNIFASIQQLSYIALIAFGAYQVTLGEMTIGALIACGIIAGRVNGPLITMLPQLIVQGGYAKSSLKALDAILALPSEQAQTAVHVRPDRLESAIRCSDLNFAYGQDAPALIVPQLSIATGERIVVIGGVGSGKSTLLKLLCGLYAPSQGSVMLGGLDAGQIAPDILRRHIGYIPQDPRLVNGTLRENLVLGLPDPGDEQILEAASQTGLDALIGSHPRGLGLAIAEGGRGLSGGQRMLTLLTRFLLLDPRIMLLDEPTSNLDQSTEARVLQRIMNMANETRSLVMVTHKLPLIRLGTRAIIMNNGKIISDDTPEKTLKKIQIKPNNEKDTSKTTEKVVAR